MIFGRQFNNDANKLLQVRSCTLRGQLHIKFAKKPLDISEVEPAAEIVKRFATGMSFCLHLNTEYYLFLFCNKDNKNVHFMKYTDNRAVL